MNFEFNFSLDRKPVRFLISVKNRVIKLYLVHLEQEQINEQLFFEIYDKKKNKTKQFAEKFELLLDFSFDSLFVAIQRVILLIFEKYLKMPINENILDFFVNNKIIFYLLATARELELIHSFLHITLGLSDEATTGCFIKYPINQHPCYQLDFLPAQMKKANKLKTRLEKIIGTFEEIQKDHRQPMYQIVNSISEFINQPISIAIVGRPNAGKSTFINALLKRNLLPHSSDTCTGCKLEIIGCQDVLDERIIVDFISQKQFDSIEQRFDNEINEKEHELSIYKLPQFAQESKVIESMEQQLEKLKNMKEQFSTIYKSLDSCKKEYSLKQGAKDILQKTAVNNSSVYSLIVSSVKIYLCSPILKYLTLVDTPGFGEDIHFRNSRAEDAVRSADGWFVFRFTFHF